MGFLERLAGTLLIASFFQIPPIFGHFQPLGVLNFGGVRAGVFIFQIPLEKLWSSVEEYLTPRSIDIPNSAQRGRRRSLGSWIWARGGESRASSFTFIQFLPPGVRRVQLVTCSNTAEASGWGWKCPSKIYFLIGSNIVTSTPFSQVYRS